MRVESWSSGLCCCVSGFACFKSLSENILTTSEQRNARVKEGHYPSLGRVTTTMYPAEHNRKRDALGEGTSNGGQGVYRLALDKATVRDTSTVREYEIRNRRSYK